MRPYWIQSDPPFGLGVGITASSEEHARALFLAAWPAGRRIAAIRPVTDMRDIEQNHVAPNMGNWLKLGIWYPQGFEHISM